MVRNSAFLVQRKVEVVMKTRASGTSANILVCKNGGHYFDSIIKILKLIKTLVSLVGIVDDPMLLLIFCFVLKHKKCTQVTKSFNYIQTHFVKVCHGTCSFKSVAFLFKLTK